MIASAWVGALTFTGLGIAVDRAFLRGPKSADAAHCAESECPVCETESASAAPHSPAGQSITQQIHLSQAAPIPPLTSASENKTRVDPPGNDRWVLDPELERQLLALIESKRPELIELQGGQTKNNADGSREIFGKTTEGASFWEHLNPQGETTRDGWSADTGESLYRSYYEDGRIKSIGWTRADHSLTNLNFTQSGLYESRYDRLPNGSSYSTTYDDLGQIHEQWKTGVDGNSVKVDL